MPTVDVLDKDGQKVGQVDLSDEVFGAEVKDHLLWEVVRAQRAKRRAGTAATKGRSAVRGTTAKMYRQKGTGRARHGTKKSPTFVGGGVAFGPVPRSYEMKVTKKVRRAALRVALTLKVAEGGLKVLDDLQFEVPKTADLAKVLNRIDANSSVIVDDKANANLVLSARNLADHKFLPVEGLNVYDLLNHKNVVVSVAAAKAADERLRSPVRPKDRRSE
ncbi:MAG: 50S ribosomal protein L4 [Deltaproteobacteria bacterium]|nr:50S ribosomal protein L4 [Deltaproteobacteria bacterium]